MVTSHPGSPKTKSFPQWVWALYFLALWQVLLSAQNPGLMSDDSGEMVAAAFNLGLPHPPGYPLMSLLGHLALFLPVGTPAFRMNLLSQLIVFLSLGIILRSCHRLTSEEERGPRGAILALAGFALISYRSLFAQAFTAKGAVYTLAFLLTSGVIYLLVTGEILGQARCRLILTWFLWAVGLGNHWQSQILWLPFLVGWGFWGERRSLKSIVFWTTFSILGASTYLYLPLRTRFSPEPCWGNPSTAQGFYWVISRQLTAGGEPWLGTGRLYWEHLQEMGRILVWDWMPGFCFLALFGWLLLAREKKRLAILLGMLGASLWLAVADFTLHDPSLVYLVNVYLVSSAGIILLCGFYGLRWLTTHEKGKPRIDRWLVSFLTFGILGWFGRVYFLENKNRYTLAEDLGINVLRSLPKGSLLLAEGDHYVFPILYQKYVLGLRRDVIFEPAVFLVHSWGWDQLASQLGKGIPEMVRKIPDSRGRFLFLIDEMGNRGGGFFYSLQRTKFNELLQTLPGEWDPEALVFRWRPHPLPLLTAAHNMMGTADGQRLRALWDFQTFPGLDFSSSEIFLYYSDQYVQAGQWIQARGNRGLALELLGKGIGYHSSAPVLNNMAVITGEMGFPALSWRLCDLAIETDPGYRPAYLNMALALSLGGRVDEAERHLQLVRELFGDAEDVEFLSGDIQRISRSGKGKESARTSSAYLEFSQQMEEKGLSFLGRLALDAATEATGVP